MARLWRQLATVTAPTLDQWRNGTEPKSRRTGSYPEIIAGFLDQREKRRQIWRDYVREQIN